MNATPKMPLSIRQMRLVRESFESLREYETSVVLLFYGRRDFEVAPETRAVQNRYSRTGKRSSEHAW